MAGTAAVAGVPVGQNQAAAAVAHVAQATLPYTGFAFGLYLLVALSLIVAGVLLRYFGRRNTPALET